LACRKGLLLSKEASCNRIVLKTDSVEVALKLDKDSKECSSHGQLVSEIKALLLGFKDSSVRAVRRTAKEAAHGLAQVGCDNKLFCV
jgi:hypothetical protein